MYTPPQFKCYQLEIEETHMPLWRGGRGKRGVRIERCLVKIAVLLIYNCYRIEFILSDC